MNVNAQMTQDKAALLAELQHRVRNMLALMRTLVRRSAETSENLEDYAMHLNGRLDALARVQSTLIRNPLTGIDLGMLVADELAVSGARDGEAVRIEGARLLLHPRAAETIGLAVHELTTNAIKFGALTAPSGRISVTWQIEAGEGGRHLIFDWIETGVTVENTSPVHHGFGRIVLEEMLAYNLKAQTALTFTPRGISFRMDLPVVEKVLVDV